MVSHTYIVHVLLGERDSTIWHPLYTKTDKSAYSHGWVPIHSGSLPYTHHMYIMSRKIIIPAICYMTCIVPPVLIMKNRAVADVKSGEGGGGQCS